MEKIIKLKTGQLFLIIILPWFMSTIPDDDLTRDILTIIGYAIYFGFYLFTYEFILSLEKETTSTFEIYFYYFIAISYILIYGLITIFFEDGESFVLKGINALVGAIIYISTFLYLAFQPAKKIMQIEKKIFGFRKSDSILVPLLALIFLPIGIWILLPKLKLIYSEVKAVEI